MIGEEICVEIYDKRRRIELKGTIVDEIVSKKKKRTHYIIEDKNGNRYIKSIG